MDPRTPFEEWELEKLANKMRQYCPLLEDMTGESLQQVSTMPSSPVFENSHAIPVLQVVT